MGGEYSLRHLSQGFNKALGPLLRRVFLQVQSTRRASTTLRFNAKGNAWGIGSTVQDFDGENIGALGPRLPGVLTFSRVIGLLLSRAERAASNFPFATKSFFFM